MPFLGSIPLLVLLHPAARLLLWLMLAIALQMLPLWALGFVSLWLMVGGSALRQHWWRLFRRTRILLLTLFLVFAYGLPGKHLLGIEWLPSHEGLLEASLHVSRLVVLLGTLAWLLVPLGHQALMGGLWFLLRPLQALGLPMDRSVVRLSLVLEYMEAMPAGQDWRQWLAPQVMQDEQDPVRLSLQPWGWGDGLWVLGGAAGLLGVIAWHA